MFLLEWSCQDFPVPDLFFQIFNVNVKATFFLAKDVISIMEQRG